MQAHAPPSPGPPESEDEERQEQVYEDDAFPPGHAKGRAEPIPG